VSHAANITSWRRAALTRRVVALLARDPPAPLAELDGLLTDVCAALLALVANGAYPGGACIAAERELLRELIAELTATRRAYERAAQTSPRRTA
jgi:hypothetical protein